MRTDISMKPFPELELLRGRGQRDARHKMRSTDRQQAFLVVRILPEDGIGGKKPENGIPQKLESLIVLGRGINHTHRRRIKRAFKERPVRESISNAFFEFSH